MSEPCLPGATEGEERILIVLGACKSASCANASASGAVSGAGAHDAVLAHQGAAGGSVLGAFDKKIGFSIRVTFEPLIQRLICF